MTFPAVPRRVRRPDATRHVDRTAGADGGLEGALDAAAACQTVDRRGQNDGLRHRPGGRHLSGHA